MKIETVSIAQILPQPLFPLHFESDSRQLKTSLSTYGLLQPLVLFRTDEGLCVLDGWERLSLLKQAGQQDILARIHEPEDLDQAQAFLLYLELNHWHRPFNIVEKSQALKTAHTVFQGKSIPAVFWEVTEIPHNVRTAQQYRDFLQLPPVLHRFAVNNRMPLSTMLLFLRFKSHEIEALAELLCRLPLNPNRLTEILSLLIDLSRRDQRSALDVLQEVLPRLDLEKSPQQKEQVLRQILHKKRNPNYEARLKEFETVVKRLSLNEKTKVEPSPFFETDHVEVHTQFSSSADIELFLKLLQHPGWSDVLAAVR